MIDCELWDPFFLTCMNASDLLLFFLFYLEPDFL
jgi:hypothetical protein